MNREVDFSFAEEVLQVNSQQESRLPQLIKGRKVDKDGEQPSS